MHEYMFIESFFEENDREVGYVVDPNHIAFPAYLLGFDKDEMHNKLLTHRMETKWGKSNEIINVQVSLIALTLSLFTKLFFKP